MQSKVDSCTDQLTTTTITRTQLKSCSAEYRFTTWAGPTASASIEAALGICEAHLPTPIRAGERGAAPSKQSSLFRQRQAAVCSCNAYFAKHCATRRISWQRLLPLMIWPEQSASRSVLQGQQSFRMSEA